MWHVSYKTRHLSPNTSLLALKHWYQSGPKVVSSVVLFDELDRSHSHAEYRMRVTTAANCCIDTDQLSKIENAGCTE